MNCYDIYHAYSTYKKHGSEFAAAASRLVGGATHNESRETLLSEPAGHEQGPGAIAANVRGSTVDSEWPDLRANSAGRASVAGSPIAHSSARGDGPGRTVRPLAKHRAFSFGHDRLRLDDRLAAAHASDPGRRTEL